MCYDVSYLRQKAEKYKQYHGITNAEDIQKQIPITYHVTGFQHPNLPVITASSRHELQAFEWGLIPFFMKDVKKAVALSNQTLNARGETIFEKPSFRSSAATARCAVLLDGFFEHHHKSDKETIPYYIHLKEEKPFFVGGLYSHWKFQDIEKTTVSIITTSANSLMEKIHNGGSNAGRMPFIIPDELIDDWLNIEAKDKAGKDHVLELIKPYDEEEMEAYTVGRLRGKSAIGNRKQVLEHVKY